MQTLTEIGRKYDTDKATFHGFTDIYDTHFRHLRASPIQLLEVGVLQGSSLKMWEEYFPAGRIYGLDITRENIIHSFSDRVRIALADQTSAGQMRAAFQEFGLQPGSLDICIDDGGHRMTQQNRCIGICWPYVKPGGTYVIEDMHTAYPELIGRHLHMPFPVGHLDETPTSAERVAKTMLGYPDQFPGVPVEEIGHVSYVSHVPTRSLTCLLTKRV
jgi:hypothetical protein